MNKRILIIGLDGASPPLVKQWRDELPHLSRLMREGVWGTLRSTLPPYTIPAWYTFATGKNPGKLGIYGFLQRQPGTYRFSFPNFSRCPAVTLWEWAGERGLSVGVFDLPGTYPPSQVNGFLVSSAMPAPTNDGRLIYTHPPELSRELDALVGHYELQTTVPYNGSNEETMIAEHERILDKHSKAVAHLLGRYDPEMFVVVYTAVDRICHQAWKHFDPTHPQHDPQRARTLGGAIKRFYVSLDSEVGRLLERITPDTNVFVVSDHGFGPQRQRFWINEWLQQKGYLRLRGRPEAARRCLTGRLLQPLVSMVRRNPVLQAVKNRLRGGDLFRRLKADFVMAQRAEITFNLADVDWRRTLAYAPSSNTLYVNLSGREPNGTVSEDEYPVFRSKLMDELRKIRDPVSGKALADQLYRGEEVYDGPHLDTAPDVVFFMDSFSCEVTTALGRDDPFEPMPVNSGNHRLEGLFIAWGPDIVSGGRQDATLADIMPTALHSLGLDVPDDLDGRVLKGIFRPQSAPASEPVRLASASDRDKTIYEWSEEEYERVQAQLRGLGYLG